LEPGDTFRTMAIMGFIVDNVDYPIDHPHDIMSNRPHNRENPEGDEFDE